MGVFCSENSAPGFQPGSSVRSISLQWFAGPTRRWLACAVAALLLPCAMHGQRTAHPAIAAADYGKLPLGFEANQGQSDQQVRFLSHGKGYSLYLTDHAAVLALSKAAQAEHTQSRSATAEPRKGDLLSMELVQPSNTTHPNGAEQLPGRANYFIGNDPAQWHTDIPTYARVKYASVYPGIDLVYYGNQRQLEYDFVVAAGADPKPVSLHFAGARKLKLNAEGDLEVIARNGEIAFHKPEIYQLLEGKRLPVEGSFQIMSGKRVRFTLGKYDRGHELVIDPALVYSSYLGGSSMDEANAIAVDTTGNAYVTGTTSSADFPVTSGAFQQVNNFQAGYVGQNAFISKINADGSALIYSTYLGGTGGSFNDYPSGDIGYGIAVDASGNAYITGQAASDDFPVTADAFQKTNKGKANGAPDSFVTKLNATGSALIYSTYLGGRGMAGFPPYQFAEGDIASGIALDGSGDAYVIGTACSANFPVSNAAYQKVLKGVTNAFVTKLNPAGSGLVYSTYLGGSIFDGGAGIAVDKAGNAYVTGSSASTDFPVTSGAYQQVNRASGTYGLYNAFVTKFTSSGALDYSTYLGGTNANGNGIAVDESGNAYVIGSTSATDFPVTSGVFQSTNNAATNDANNVFVTKINPTGSELVYSTYLGGSGQSSSDANLGDAGTGIAVDGAGNAYLVGSAYSTNFPVTEDAFQTVNSALVFMFYNLTGAYPGYNAFFATLNPEGSALDYSTYLGGAYSDSASGVAVDASGNAYVAGIASSRNFPTSSGAFQVLNNSGANANGTGFVSKFSLTSPLEPTRTVLKSSWNPQRIGLNVTFTVNVLPATGSGIPTGSISLRVDGGTPTNATLNGSGQFSFTTNVLSNGRHTIEAVYGGDSNYAPSDSMLAQTIVGTPTKVTIFSGSGQLTGYGSWFKYPLIVYVTDANGSPVPDVEVNFTGSGLLFFHAKEATNSAGAIDMSVKATAVSANLTGYVTVSGVPSASFSEDAQFVPLTVKANNVTIPYGKAIPPLTYTITGYVNDDGPSVVTGAPTESTEAVKGSPIGTYPIVLGQGTLAAANYGFNLLQGALTITSDGTAAKPYFSPAGNTYALGQMIAITDSTPGAVIHYTTDGSVPTTSSPIYFGPITLNSAETINALAVAPGYTNSPIQSERYWIK